MDTSITTFTGFLVGLTGEEISKVQEEAGTKLNLEFADHPVGQSAAQQQADLLVIGRGKTRGVFGALRTHTFGIIRETRCPVLSYCMPEQNTN